LCNTCDATKLVPQARAVRGPLPGAPQDSDSNATTTLTAVTGKILGGGGVRGAVRGAAWDENSKRRCSASPVERGHRAGSRDRNAPYRALG